MDERQPVRRFLRRVLVSDHPWPWLAPATAMILAFGIYPLLYSIWLSFHEWNRFTRAFSFVGVEQWAKALGDPRMWHSLGVTTIYTVACLIIELALGLLIAVLLDRDRKGYGVLRALMTLPLVVPPAVTGLMFLLMLDGQFGVLTYYGVFVGILERAQPLLGDTNLALVGVMIADIWQWTPFMVLIFLAGLRALPRDPFEAAAIDGANAFQVFWKLTVPMLGRVAAVAILIRAIDLFRIYDYIYVMTGGGPGTATEALSFYAGRVFTTGNFPYAATVSLITLVVLIIAANVFIRLFRVRF
jgi:multiple sugar transport system permease protein